MDQSDLSIAVQSLYCQKSNKIYFGGIFYCGKSDYQASNNTIMNVVVGT